jgi:murein DD-endopeptidase MepM/ murein hydrolase activator NlpD
MTSQEWSWPLPVLEEHPRIISVRDHVLELGYDDDIDERIVPVLAARDGVILFAARSPQGHSITIDHRDGSSAHYAGLDDLAMLCTDRFRRRRKQHVRRGDVVGFCVRAPHRMQFELWQRAETGDIAMDASGCLGNARALPRPNCNPRRLAA